MLRLLVQSFCTSFSKISSSKQLTQMYRAFESKPTISSGLRLLRYLGGFERNRSPNILQQQMNEIKSYTFKVILDTLKSLKPIQTDELFDMLRFVSNDKQNTYDMMKRPILEKLLVDDHTKWVNSQIYYFMKVGKQESYNKTFYKRFRNKLIMAMEDNFPKVSLNLIFSFILEFDYVNRSKSQTLRAKFIKILQLIQQRVIQELPRMNMLDQNNRKVLEAPHFFLTLLHYSAMHRHVNKPLCQMIEKRAIELIQTTSEKTNIEGKNLFKTWATFYIRMVYAGKFGHNLEQFALQLYNKYPSFKEQIQNHERKYLCRVVNVSIILKQSILWSQLKTDRINDIPVVLKQPLPEIEPSQIIKIMIPKLEEVMPNIRQFYGKYLLKKSYKNYVYDNETNQTNQFCFEVAKILQQLGFKFQKEAQILGRRCDILLENKIILELDGDVHYANLNESFNMQDISAKTASRNYTYLHGGYRLLIITVEQYQLERHRGTLAEFILLKYKTLTDNPNILAVL